jgi:glycerol-3-phosphate dehydrogenase (NAD(P)+)
MPGIGDRFVTGMGGRHVKVGRPVGSGLNARRRASGRRGIEIIGGALPRLTERGIIEPEGFSLIRHLHAVVAKDESLDMLWRAFFGGEPQRRK